MVRGSAAQTPDGEITAGPRFSILSLSFIDVTLRAQAVSYRLLTAEA